MRGVLAAVPAPTTSRRCGTTQRRCRLRCQLHLLRQRRRCRQCPRQRSRSSLHSRSRHQCQWFVPSRRCRPPRPPRLLHRCLLCRATTRMRTMRTMSCWTGFTHRRSTKRRARANLSLKMIRTTTAACRCLDTQASRASSRRVRVRVRVAAMLALHPLRIPSRRRTPSWRSSFMLQWRRRKCEGAASLPRPSLRHPPRWRSGSRSSASCVANQLESPLRARSA